jgi:two-component system, chemotaxis family, protein-glutamate methylesterase/glutaminase
MESDQWTRSIDAIAIGASAGGVEVLSMLLPMLRPGCRLAVFIVMHIPRERPSLLPEIFAAKCALPVREAEDKEPVQPGTVYFAPPDYHLLLDRGPAFALSSDEPVHFSRPSIDVLFESAADVYGERLMGLILTGANEDGAQGLAAVGRAGGRTVVQEPGSALAAYLPQSALQQAPVDFVLSVKQMQDLLAAFGAAGMRDSPWRPAE